MHFYGYARVSTTGQDLTIQREALKAAGCKVIREENSIHQQSDLDRFRAGRPGSI